MTTDTNKATTQAPAQRTAPAAPAAPAAAEATRTVLMAPGVELDEETTYALTDLRDRQEARVVALQRTRMALRRATKVEPPPPDQDAKPPTPVDTSHLHELVQWPTVTPIAEPQSFTDAPPAGEFRPVMTELRKEGGLQAENLTDGTHFFGRIHYGGDNLITFSVGSTSHFVLNPGDIPASASGRYRSAPPADVRGVLYGETGYYLPPFAADDKWCHCRRILRHALWQNVNAQWRALGERQQVDTLINLENEVSVGTAVVPLSGFMPMPSLEVALQDPNVPVWAQVEIRFEVDLEGDSKIHFSPENNPGGSVVVRSFGWWARPTQ